MHSVLDPLSEVDCGEAIYHTSWFAGQNLGIRREEGIFQHP
jgi:hypothetical protein